MLDNRTFNRHVFSDDLTRLTELVMNVYTVQFHNMVVIPENIMFDRENRMYLIDFGTEPGLVVMNKKNVVPSMISKLIIP